MDLRRETSDSNKPQIVPVFSLNQQKIKVNAISHHITV